MADQRDVDVIIEQTFIAGWNATVDYYFANAPVPNTMPGTYINVLSYPGSRTNISLGSKICQRNICSLIGEVRYPKHIGSGPLMDYAEEFGAIFENKTISGVHFREANITPSPTPTHYGYNVLIPYIWDSYT